MPSLAYDNLFLNLLRDDYSRFPCFIETGTLNGDTIFYMEPYFKSLFTIEISNYYYEKTRHKYKGDKINFILGDSSEVFKDLLPLIKDNSIFFLDGHWSGGDTGKGNKDVPLIEEIRYINKLFKQEAIIIIDDCRLLGTPEGNWSEISSEKILDEIHNRISKVYYLDSEFAKNDRLIIHINAKD